MSAKVPEVAAHLPWPMGSMACKTLSFDGTHDHLESSTVTSYNHHSVYAVAQTYSGSGVNE